MYKIVEYQGIERSINVSVIFCYSLTCDYHLSVFRSSRVFLITSEVHDNLEGKLEHHSCASILKSRDSETERDLKLFQNSPNGLKNHASLHGFPHLCLHNLPSFVYHLRAARAPLEDFYVRSVE